MSRKKAHKVQQCHEGRLKESKLSFMKKNQMIVSFSMFVPVHYGNIFEYLSLWSEVQFLRLQKCPQKNRKSKT